MQEIDDIIKSNTGLIYKQLSKYYLVGNPDAESEAYWALYSAAKTYNDSMNVLFSTYATCCIYNALGCYVRSLHRKRQLEIVSYNAIIFDNTEYSEVLPADETTESTVVRKETVKLTRQAIEDILNKTSNCKHKLIIQIFIANEYDITATAISKQIGVSQSYVSQALAEFKAKLKKKMEVYYNA
jgi:RNA polymerase sigma factor (sigma-70 family)